MKRRFPCMFLSVVLAGGLLAGCGGQKTGTVPEKEQAGTQKAAAEAASQAAPEGASDEITVWTSLTQEEIDNYVEDFNAVNPDIKVNAVVFPTDTYMTKLEAALRSGTGAPDVFLAEIRDLGKLKGSDLIEDLSGEPYGAAELMDDFIPYVAELCKDDDGHIIGLSYQSCPGGFWYYKPLAKEYLGTDDPEEVQKLLPDWDSIAAIGEEVYEKSGGEVYLMDSPASVVAPILGTRPGAYVQDGKMLELSYFRNVMETALKIREHHGDAMLDAWDATWASCFYGNNKFILFGQPSWGLHYCVKANTPADAADTDNTWGFIQAPAAYQDGGTWLSMYSGSQHKEAAWTVIKTITADEDYLLRYVERTGDMVGYKPAIEKVIADGFRDPFTGDQNIYQAMYDAAMEIKPLSMTKYDIAIENSFKNDKLKLALTGEMSIDEAMQAFADDMQTQFPELTIE